MKWILNIPKRINTMDKAKADFTQDLEKRGTLSLGYKIFRAVFILLLVVSVAKNVSYGRSMRDCKRATYTPLPATQIGIETIS